MFGLNEGNICFKSRIPSAPWHELEVLPEMKGDISELSLDGTRLAARSRKGNIFVMKKALEEPKHFRWTAGWGLPFGLGEGLTLPEDVKLWDFSYLSPRLDRSYVDSVGQNHFIGFGVTSLFAVRGDARTITYFDPWLPIDTSYEVCGPHRGRLRLAAFSASGSTMMAMDKYGNIFVRRYDFDIAGADTIVFDYTYEKKNAHFGFLAFFLSERKLPVPEWEPLPKIQGRITNKISIEKVGKGAKVRYLRVEGIKDGRSGYYEAKYDFVERSPDLCPVDWPVEWKFFPTDLPLEGKFIKKSALKYGGLDLGSSRDQQFIFDLHDENMTAHLELVDFNLKCSPAVLRVSFDSEDDSMDLILHVTEKLRICRRDEDADDDPLYQNGMLEIPKSLMENFEQLSSRKQDFITRYLDKDRFSKVRLSIREDRINLKIRRCGTEVWKFIRR
jgi:hypothetical protein